MPETIIESVLTGKLDSDLLLKWLKNETSNDSHENCLMYCNRNEFAAYFLSYLRNQTHSILETNSSTIPPLHQTPEKINNSQRKHRRSISEPTSDNSKDSLNVSQMHRSHESPSRDKKKTGRRVKTKLFPEDKNLSVSSDESKLCSGVERVAISSTPLKNGSKISDYPNLASPVTPQRSYKENERCDTPRLNHRHRSNEKSCLGDYLISAQKVNKKKKNGRNTSDDSESRIELDLSSSDAFPEIGARKSSSLRSEKKRIKPTNLDKGTSRKSLSLNSFSSDSFQSSPLAMKENDVFKQQTAILQPEESAASFDAERSILKQERQKLMEKFNILNTSTNTKTITPQIKITLKETYEKERKVVKADVSKIVHKDKLDLLADVYKVLIDSNLVLSMNTEIYFLISIILSNQNEEDYNEIDSKLKTDMANYLLKSIHNCSYFAVRSLWYTRIVLEVLLHKRSLKILGENKKVRCFCPDLAKFLLNSYGLKCELENNVERKTAEVGRSSNGVICFNHETDNLDNFPTVYSFQNFKKQRDMFYEIVRWYQEMQPNRFSKSSFRGMIKTLISCGVSPTNYAHLAALFMQHMIAECIPANLQESKLSKLQRRLTSPKTVKSHRLPSFSPKEMFYKDFIIHNENEPFRVHLRDALCSEIVSLDSTPFPFEERSNANNSDVSNEYHSIAKKMAVLGKFLGFLTSLPYTQTTEPNTKTLAAVKETTSSYQQPKERVMENEIALRNHIQPAIDLKNMLTNAYQNSRLIVTVPWMVHYLSMLDYTTFRTRYYQDILKILRQIYSERLKIEDTAPRKRFLTVIFLKSVLGWLFDLPHCPQEVTSDISVQSVVNIDDYNVIDDVILFDLCPYLKDLNVLLSTCKVGHEQKDIGSFRHITPVSLSLNPEDRMRSKERELQSRLEEEMLKSQPSSSRRVLEMVTERVAAATVRDLARPLAATRDRVMAQAVRMVKDRGSTTQAILLQSLQALYNDNLQQLRSTALETSKVSIRRRTGAALLALLPTAPVPLQALAVNNCVNKVSKWVDDHWNSTTVLCKDIEADMKNLMALGEAACLSPKPASNVEALTVSDELFEAANVSATASIINLKEQICILLDHEEPSDLIELLKSCAIACSPNNLFTRPATTKAILQLSVDMCVVYVSRKPNDVNEEFLNAIQSIWHTCCPDRRRSVPRDISPPERRAELSPDFRNFADDDRAPTPISDDENCEKITRIIIRPSTSSLSPTVGKSFNCGLKKSSSTKSVTNDCVTPDKIAIRRVTSDKSVVRSVTSDKSVIRSVTSDNIVKSDRSVSSDSNLVKSVSQADNSSRIDESVNAEDNSAEYLEFFDRIMCPRNIVIMNSSRSKKSDVWESLATVLVFLLENDYLSEDSLTEQCLAVYRQDWPQNILENLSNCMKSVSARWSRSSNGKFTLFLEFLAEYCGDMEYDPLD